MVFPAIKALFRRIMMRISAVLPVFFQFCCEKTPYFWSDFCILKVKFLHISDLLFSYKQMVFPEIKALFRRILMHIFAILPGFFNFAVKKKRIFDQIVVIWRSNFCIFQIFYFLTSRWFSQKLMLYSVVFWCVFLHFRQVFLFCCEKNVFLIRFLYFEGQIFAYFRSSISLQADGFPSNWSSSIPLFFDAYFCSFASFF